MNTLYEVGFLDPNSKEEYLAYLTLEEILQAPTGMNVADAGLHLLNLEREKLGMGKIPSEQMAPYFKSSGNEGKSA